MITHWDVMEKTCEIADFLTIRYCKKNGIENPIIYPDDPDDCSFYSDEAQKVFDDYYDYLERKVECKLLRMKVRKDS